MPAADYPIPNLPSHVKVCKKGIIQLLGRTRLTTIFPSFSFADDSRHWRWVRV